MCQFGFPMSSETSRTCSFDSSTWPVNSPCASDVTDTVRCFPFEVGGRDDVLSSEKPPSWIDKCRPLTSCTNKIPALAIAPLTHEVPAPAIQTRLPFQIRPATCKSHLVPPSIGRP